MKASASDNSDNTLLTVVFGVLAGCVVWGTLIYCCFRQCRKIAERPQVMQIIQNEPQIHYIVHQDTMGPDGCPLPAVDADGRPIMYQQVQGQFMPVTSYQPPTAAAPVAAQYSPKV